MSEIYGTGDHWLFSGGTKTIALFLVAHFTQRQHLEIACWEFCFFPSLVRWHFPDGHQSCSSPQLSRVLLRRFLFSGCPFLISDFFPGGLVGRGARNRSCSSLNNRKLTQTCLPDSPDDEVSGHSQTTVDRPRSRTCSHSRLSNCSSESVGVSERDCLDLAREDKATPSSKPLKMCCGVFSQPAAPQTPCTHCSVPVNSLPHRCLKRTAQQRARKNAICNIVRSTSDPLSCSATTEGKGVFRSKGSFFLVMVSICCLTITHPNTTTKKALSPMVVGMRKVRIRAKSGIAGT